MSGQQQQQQQQRQSRSIVDASTASQNVFAVMEQVYEKLQVLDYQREMCRNKGYRHLTREYFALRTNPSDQFPYFSSLVAWLLTQMQHQFIEWTEYEDPNTVASNIVVEVKKLGFAADFPVNKLQVGSGVEVCLVLDFLTTQVLKHRGFVVLQPQAEPVDDEEEEIGGAFGGDDDDDEEVDGDGLADNFGDAEDDLGDDYMYGASGARPRTGSARDGADALNNLGGGDDDGRRGAYVDDTPVTQGVLESKVDPAEWRLELERVGPLLKFRSNVHAKEWRTHLEQGKKHKSLLAQESPPALDTLTKMNEQLTKAVERIRGKETHINREFESLGGEFRSKQTQLEAIQSQYNELSQTISSLTSELANKVEAVEMIKSQMSDRNNSMTDTSPLRRISSSLQALKKEVADMELRIGVASQTLLAARVKAAVHQQQQHHHGHRSK